MNEVLDRFLMTISVFIYALSIHFAHVYYLPFQTHIPFYNQGTFDVYKMFLFIFLLLPFSLILSKCLKKPSHIFVYILFFLLYIPSVVIILGNEYNLKFDHFVLLICIFLGFLLIVLSSQVVTIHRKGSIFPGNYFVSFSVFSWFLLFIILINKYHSMMSFHGLDTIYTQRAIASNMAGVVDGYAQLYLGYFFSPFLYLCGLYKRKLWMLFLGIVGCITLYLITAERTAFMILFFVTAIYIFIALKWGLKEFAFLVLLASLSNIIVVLFFENSKFLYDFGFYFLNRMATTPGLFLIQYYDFFSAEGFTNWNHVKGVNLFVDASDGILKYDQYPELGQLIAQEVHGIKSNSTASFWAKDGVAAYGALGVIVISGLLSLYLVSIDFLSRKWTPKFTIPMLSVLALVLVNGSFFTALLSFGGLVLFFYFFCVSLFCVRSKSS